MEATGGRPRGRPLSDIETRHLLLLYRTRTAAETHATHWATKLEDFVLHLRENENYTGRAIAEALGVGKTTVQTWERNARRRRDSRRDG